LAGDIWGKSPKVFGPPKRIKSETIQIRATAGLFNSNI
jgi:hypothetical protein